MIGMWSAYLFIMCMNVQVSSNRTITVPCDVFVPKVLCDIILCNEMANYTLLKIWKDLKKTKKSQFVEPELQ